MTQVTHAQHRAATPSAVVVEAFAVAVARVDHAALHGLLTDDVRWRQVGRRPVVGKDAVLKVLDRYGPATSLTIHHIVSDGCSGAVDGEVELGRHRAFCHVVEFDDDGARVKAFTTYLVADG
jgi:hypothetical protein